MALNPTVYSTRAVSMLMLAAFGGLALWLFAPFGSGAGTDWTPGGSAALPSSLRVDGDVQVTAQDGVVTELVVPLTLRGDEPIDLGHDFRLRAETSLAPTAHAAVPASYTLAWLDGNGDQVLDAGEHAVLTVTLPGTSSVHPENPLRLVLRADAHALIIEDVIR